MLQVHLLRISRSFPVSSSDNAVQDGSLDPLLDLVDEVMCEDVRKYRFLRDARRCLCGRLLARYVAATRLDRPWSALTFGKSERGRPHLTQPLATSPALDFNTSHDGDLVAVASLPSLSSPPSRVGVDIMRIRNPWEDTSIPEFIDGIAEELTPTELAALAALPSPDPEAGLRHALALWTLKEAYVKALGEGLHLDLRRVEFRLALGGANEGEGRRDGARIEGWRFCLAEIEGGEGEREETYFLAVAEQADGARGEVRILPRGARLEWLQEVDLAAIEAFARNAG